jgi:hypothetical protein
MHPQRRIESPRKTQVRRCAGYRRLANINSLPDAEVDSADGSAMPKADDDETVDATEIL